MILSAISRSYTLHFRVFSIMTGLTHLLITCNINQVDHGKKDYKFGIGLSLSP